VDTVEHGLSLHREPALLGKMAENGQTLVPTLSTFHDVSEDHAEKYPCALVGQAERQREEAYETLAAARAAGVRIAMGFDSYPLGQNARELVRMVEGGLTPMEGIVAATSGAADALGLADVGRVDRRRRRRPRRPRRGPAVRSGRPARRRAHQPRRPGGRDRLGAPRLRQGTRTE
jgi:imidazolonepropionase-like amidohydrolase